ncbi:MAG: hypothetical protein COY58_00745 [Gammaproteobacteria bacterium CG_4_10_14_0_8_um_filter_38_16]|nr:MAG: hypothetical protein COY58_00745 [Gammaproteobacteria bacterium CG_4_10_14_0_8_um_filter_38_16]PJA04325.1 MAG: hypothetical protein COX72_00675 [Gammaproteobacteria bacterium CG_4_10_14_0_2_um_filter_38_22]PJB10079.1 MAG: hypothetical protein CO120_06685 [Gammaproteobacteria bacterium CG_4_9_14_3_um_filter_38_9]
MAKYEALPTTLIRPNGTMLQANHLPELVHMDDPAISVMIDFTLTPAHIITPNDTMDHAISEMEVSGVHLLLVINEEGHFQGIISSEDVWGEKPIKLIQERRVHRDQVLVRAIMVPYTEITALDFFMIKTAKVGHIVKTLSEHKQHYALAVSPSTTDANIQTIRGIFTASQISKQLHTDITDVFGDAI